MAGQQRYSPQLKLAIRRDYIQGRFPSIKDAAASHGVRHQTAQAWAKLGKWTALRSQWALDHHLDNDILCLPKLLPSSGPCPATIAAIDHAGALAACVTEPDALEKIARALQTLELTRFAVTNGYWPGNPKPSPDVPKPNTPKRLKPSEREPLARLIPPSPPEPDASAPSDS
jgi:hypothetical protein